MRSSGVPLVPAIIMIAALSVTMAALALGRGASGQSGTTLSFDVGTPGGCAAVGVGDEIEVALVITNVEQLQHWEATISHDFGVIRVIGHDTSIFLSGFDASEPVPDTDGQHFLGIGTTKAASAVGPATLATVTFKAVASGVSVIDIPQTDFDGNGDTDMGAILTQNGGARIGDVNGDGFFDGPVQSALIAVNAGCGSPTEQPTDPPTPKPATPVPTPTAPATPAPTAVGPSPTPTQSAGIGPTPTSPPGSLVWGDGNCSGGADPVDSLITMRFDAGLGANTGACPDMGEVVDVASGSPHPWGDVDCSGEINPVDSLKILRFDAGLGVPPPAGCPAIGSLVTITGA